MNKLVLSLAFSVLVSLPVLAALKVGEKAPDFSARASLAGKEFDFSLQNCPEKGPRRRLFLSLRLYQRL